MYPQIIVVLILAEKGSKFGDILEFSHFLNSKHKFSAKDLNLKRFQKLLYPQIE